MRRNRISENLHPQQQPQAPRMNPLLLILLPDLDKPSLIRHLKTRTEVSMTVLALPDLRLLLYCHFLELVPRRDDLLLHIVRQLGRSDSRTFVA